MRFLFFVFLACRLCAQGEQEASEKLGVYVKTNGASIQLLDKITGRMSTALIKIGQTEVFGTLRIQIQYCQKNPPEEPPESKVFVKVWEEKIGQDEKTILFSNWMFSSSPSISTLEHPVYGVWVKECVNID